MKKKVLFVATVVKTHIMEFHIPYLRMLQEMGWETAVAAKNDYEHPADCVIPYCDAYYDIPIARVPWSLSNLTAYRRLKQLMDREQYDVIHCHTPVGAVVARLAALATRKKGTKVIYTAHGFHFYKGSSLLNWIFFYPVEQILSRVTDILITMNQEDYALAKRKMRAGRIEYTPGVGIDTSRFRKVTVSRQEKRQELGFGQEDFLILTVAEMTKNKNHSTVLKALALLKDKPEYSHIRYLICGRGKNEQNLRREVKNLGLEEHVVFLGYRHDVPELLYSADMFAFMSYREGLSVALMEAMSSQLPVVCSRIRGNTDLITDGQEGLMADNNPQAVAQAIERLYGEPELRKTLGAAAARKVRLFDQENVHHIVRDIYRSI